MKTKVSKAHTLLISPPVWTPIYPYLALPVLTAYLRREGYSVSQYDASLDFFMHQLQVPAEVSACSNPSSAPDRADLPHETAPGDSGHAVAALRDPGRFFDPQQVILSQQALRRGLQRLSTAHHPASIGFSHFRYPEIRSAREMLDFCDAAENPFLHFCRSVLAKKIEQECPHVVGISLSTPYQLHATLTMGRSIKRAFPEVHVVLGGKHCQALHDKLAREPHLFGTFFDTLIPHKGEGPLRGLVEALSYGRGLETVPGLTFLDNGSVRINQAPPPHPLETLPPPDFQDLYYHPHFEVMPPAKAVDQIEHLQGTHGVADISINDDCLPPAYLEGFCREILDRGLDLSLQLFGRPVRGFTRRRLELLAKSGVREIRWGIESANRRILRLMNKGADIDHSLQVLQDATDCGIWNHACVILGFPSETRAEAEETVRWIQEHREFVHSYFIFEFHLSVESYIYRNPAVFGIREIIPQQGPFSTLATFSTSGGMNRHEVRNLVRDARKELLACIYVHPFWYYLRDREYLQFYLGRFGLRSTRDMRVNPEDFSVHCP
jgi:hypothetical protein